MNQVTVQTQLYIVLIVLIDRIGIEFLDSPRSIGQIIGRGHNQPIGTTDPTAHAEIVAMRAAANHLGAYRLVETTLVATLEPCFMCCGAMIHARVGTLVYGAEDPKGGAVELLDSFPRFNHRIEVVGGIEAERCGDILREYFRGKRS